MKEYKVIRETRQNTALLQTAIDLYSEQGYVITVAPCEWEGAIVVIMERGVSTITRETRRGDF